MRFVFHIRHGIWFTRKGWYRTRHYQYEGESVHLLGAVTIGFSTSIKEDRANKEVAHGR